MNLNNMGTGRQVLQNVLAQTRIKQWSKDQQEKSQKSIKPGNKANKDER